MMGIIKLLPLLCLHLIRLPADAKADVTALPPKFTSTDPSASSASVSARTETPLSEQESTAGSSQDESTPTPTSTMSVSVLQTGSTVSSDSSSTRGQATTFAGFLPSNVTSTTDTPMMSSSEETSSPQSAGPGFTSKATSTLSSDVTSSLTTASNRTNDTMSVAAASQGDSSSGEPSDSESSTLGFSDRLNELLWRSPSSSSAISSPPSLVVQQSLTSQPTLETGRRTSVESRWSSSLPSPTEQLPTSETASETDTSAVAVSAPDSTFLQISPAVSSTLPVSAGLSTNESTSVSSPQPPTETTSSVISTGSSSTTSSTRSLGDPAPSTSDTRASMPRSQSPTVSTLSSPVGSTQSLLPSAASSSSVTASASTERQPRQSTASHETVGVTTESATIKPAAGQECPPCINEDDSCKCQDDSRIRIEPLFVLNTTTSTTTQKSIWQLEDIRRLRRVSTCRDEPFVFGYCTKRIQAWSYFGGNVCLPFIFSGCGPSKNVFAAKQECLSKCGMTTTRLNWRFFLR